MIIPSNEGLETLLLPASICQSLSELALFIMEEK